MAPAIVGCSYYSSLRHHSKIILYLVLVACVPQLARAFMGRTPALNILYNVNMAVEFLLLFLFFRDSFSSSARNRLFNLLAAIAILVGIISISSFGINSRFLSEWLCLNNLVYTSWILLLIYELYGNDQWTWRGKGAFLIYIIGLFFYSSCTILIFGLWHYIMANVDSYVKNLWIIHDVFNIFMYTAFTAGFIIERAGTLPNRKRST